MADVITVRDLHIGYGKEEVLRGIDLSLERGEVLGILGPNGSGKSTLMSILCGILRNWQGSVTIMDRALKSYPSRRLAQVLSYIPQSFEPSFDLKVETIVSFGRNPHLKGFSALGARDYVVIDEVMTLTETLGFKERFFSTLSGGEKQRVVIAKALAQEGQILLMDEFTSHLDPGHARKIGKIATDLVRAKGLSAVAVFHDLNQAIEMSDRLIFMKDGEIAAHGRVWDIVNPAVIWNVYGLRAQIITNPVTELPLVVFYD